MNALRAFGLPLGVAFQLRDDLLGVFGDPADPAAVVHIADAPQGLARHVPLVAGIAGDMSRVFRELGEAYLARPRTDPGPWRETLAGAAAAAVAGDGALLGSQAPTIRVAVRGTQVVFLARGSAPYRLALGDAAAHSAALPLGTLIPGYEPKRLASLGRATAPEQVPAAVQQAADAAQSAADWKRVGLWGVLLAGVALLGGMAFSLLRQAKPGEH